MLILLRVIFGCPNRKCLLKVSWYGEPIISATRQILALARVDSGRLKRKFSVTEVSRLVEAASKAVTKSTTKRAKRYSARRFSATLTEVFI